MNYTVKQRINNAHSLPAYSNDADGPCYLSIAFFNGKCGILTDTGDEFLPFEYDNISICGFGLLQVIQSGKIGIIHISGSAKGGFLLERLIACEYDFLDFQHCDYILLRKDAESGFHYRVYFPRLKLFSEECTNVFPINQEYVELSGPNFRKVMNATTGIVVNDDTDYFCIGSYSIECGEVIQEASYSLEKSRLLFIDHTEQILESISSDSCDAPLDKPGIKKVEFLGRCNAVYPLEDDESQPEANAFVIETDEGLCVLDSCGVPMNPTRFTSVKVATTLKAHNKYTGENEEIELFAPHVFWHG